MDQLAQLNGLSNAPDGPERPALDDAEVDPLELEAETRAQKGVVADLRVRIERQVVGGDRQLCTEGGAQAPRHPLAERRRRVAPEEPMVDEQHLGAGAERALDQLGVRRDPASTTFDTSPVPGTCRPFGP